MQAITKIIASLLCSYSLLAHAQTPISEDCSSKFSDYLSFRDKVEAGNESYRRYTGGCSKRSREECAKDYLITGAVETFNIVQEYNNDHENSSYNMVNIPACQKTMDIPKPIRALKAI